ncbi:MAG: lytic transglycosylase domain-containing protein [Alphaproteobacteria bacterium]
MIRSGGGFRLFSVVFLGLFTGWAAPVTAQNPAALETASLPRGGDGQNPEATAPRVIDLADTARYQEIFRLQEAGRWSAADRLIAQLSDNLLMGHVLYQRYMHPTAYRSRYAELKGWLDKYADHPGAPAIYALALRRKPQNWKAPKKPVTVSVSSVAAAAATGTAEQDSRRLSRKQYIAIRQATNRIKSLVRRERPSAALKLVESKEFRRILDPVGFDNNLAIIARGYFHAGKNADALSLAERAVKRSGLSVPDGYWWAGLAAWRLGEYQTAATHFAALAQDKGAGDAWARSAAAFWASRAWLQARKPENVTPMLRIAAQFPQTFYGLLAIQALDDAVPFNWNLPTLGAVEIDLLQHIPAAKRALALLEVGQSVLAESELKRLTGAPSPELSRVLLALVGKANLPDVSIRLGSRMQRSQGETYDAALFPVPAWQPQGGYALDKALLLAFMRQESRFRTNARSRAGATGLMQLMPATARFIARGDAAFSGRRDLYDPETNMSLGQKYIQHLIDDPAIGDNLFYMATAYNAGPGNLRKWQRQVDYRDDPLLFIESIRARETRNFIERVLTNFWVYRLRLGQDVPSLEAVAAGEWPVYIPFDEAITQSESHAD